MSSRDEILANFQAFTGMDDLGTCIGILESHNWDLLSAVNSIVPQEFSDESQGQQISAPVQETGNRHEEAELVDGLRNPPDESAIVFENHIRQPNHMTHPQEPHLSTEKRRSPEHSSEEGGGGEGGSTCSEEYDDARETLSEDEVEGEGGSTCSEEYDDARETLSEDEVEGDGEAITDDMFLADEAPLDKDPLIPEDCEDPFECSLYLSQRFESRYGSPHPMFFVGSLSDAVKEACGASVSERRPMFIYLHHDKSILSNIFCSQLLCCESIVSFLINHYLVWAWDLTNEKLKRKLLDMVRECFGTLVSNNVDDIKPDHLPAILIVYKSKGQMEVRNIIQGQSDPDLLLSSLIIANDQHEQVKETDRKEEMERIAREEEKARQEAAFRESLRADQEKDRIKMEDEKLKQEKEREEILEKERKEELRRQMEDLIPPEPDSSHSKVSTLRLRFPDGSTAQRRFLPSHTVGNLLNFVGSKGYQSEEFKLLTSFPKKDVTSYHPHLTLEEVNLHPQETLFIEER